MMRPLTLTIIALGSVLVTAGAAKPALAQWDAWDPWLLGPTYRTSYYAPAYSGGYSSFYGGYWTGYAPAAACNSCCYGPAPACCCSPCGGCSNCADGNCASGACGLNAAPAGPPKPMADPDLDRVPGRSNSGGRTFDPNDDRNYENPDRTGTGSNLDNARPFNRRGTGSGTSGDDGFRPRSGGTGTGTGTGSELERNPDPFKENKANKVELKDPDIPQVPEKSPAAPMDVKEETPVDAASELEGKVTNRPVLVRERLAMKSRFTTPSVAKTPAPAKINWSVAPVTARVARQ